MKGQKNRRPKRSVETNFWAAIGISGCVSFLVLFGLKESLWLELEFVVGILSTLFFVHLVHVLFHGFRFNKNGKYTITWESVDFPSVLDEASYFNTQGSFTAADNAGIHDFLIDLIVSIILSFVVALVLLAGVNIFVSSVLILFFPAFYLFKRSLVYAVAKGQYCQNNPSNSFLYSLK